MDARARGAFLDSIEGERLFALFVLAAYCGLRRDEVIGLTWVEADLDQGVIFVRETGSGEGPKWYWSVNRVAVISARIHSCRGSSRCLLVSALSSARNS